MGIDLARLAGGFDPRETYVDFYGNEAIRRISGRRAWSVSTSSKKPIDMGWVRDIPYLRQLPPETEDPPGARLDDESTMATLDEVTDLIPNATNVAYHLDAQRDGIVILDVEKSADDALKKKVLGLRDLYRERSMSHGGYHMVFPMPYDMLDHYGLQFVPVLKRADGAFELHMVHWVTFTRDTEWDEDKHCDGDTYVSERDGRLRPGDEAPLPPAGDGSFEDFIRPFLRMQARVRRDSVQRAVDIDQATSLTTSEMELVDRVEGLMRDDPEYRYGKNPSWFDNDMSRYEFGYVAHILAVLGRFCGEYEMAGRTIRHEVCPTESELAMMAYELARRLVPPRAKHSESRCGMPWLMYQVRGVMSRRA